MIKLIFHHQVRRFFFSSSRMEENKGEIRVKIKYFFLFKYKRKRKHIRMKDENNLWETQTINYNIKK